MKLKTIKLLIVAFVLMIFSSVNAQVFQFTANGYASNVFGDLAKKELNNSGAGYVDFGSGGGIEFKFYINNLGLGLKWSYSYYERDIESYKTDLRAELGITDEKYNMTQPYAYRSHSSLLGLSYIFRLSDKFQLEPYFNFGLKTFTSPFEHAVYSKNNTTFTYRKDAKLYLGFCYAPGLKFQWNITKNIGLNIFSEYEGAAFYEDVEESITHSYNSFEINSVNKTYSPQSLNVGIGVAYSFGKGLNK